ncbi:EamA/RhaT family transporter [Brumimicrobium glaciale]|uniref:EamA/RhaT family transporter n=1 Tax=Brumimicrobium glaciale TaxID=200475 RepID=A0A4Q4KLD5_9FLAO|nr:EamA family transporter [Brumimicrobium glaciale]RYM33547.1 EamA/RhaT family transporter [Brumimicrobium glaciale]
MKGIFGNRWFLLVILALTWGSSFIMIKKSLLEFSPFEIGSLRVLISGVILSFIGIPVIRKMKKKSLFYVALSGLFGNFLPLYLFPIAQTHISSSLAGVLDSLVPIFVLVLGFIFYGVRTQISQVFGAIIGFFGAATLMFFSESNTEETQIGYALLIVFATICYAIAALIVKDKLGHLTSIELTASMFTMWAVPALVILLSTGFFSSHESTPETWTAFGFVSILAIFGTTIAIVIYYKLIQDTTPIFASSVSYLLPILAIMWGLLDGEKFSPWYIFSGVLILIGVYLIREKKAKPRMVPR